MVYFINNTEKNIKAKLLKILIQDIENLENIKNILDKLCTFEIDLNNDKFVYEDVEYGIIK